MTENHGLRVGDEVAIGRRGSYSIHKISKITPSGRIKLESGMELNPDLSIRGASKWGGPFRASLVTPVIREAIERESLIDQISLANWRIPNIDQLRRIVAILKEENPK